MPEVAHVVLFDIDGTLVRTGRAGARGMNAAFARLYGVAGALDAVSLAGRTDRAIVSDVLRGIGRDVTDATIELLRDAYLEHLESELAKPVAGAEVLPGVASVLDALETRGDVVVGLLTGNFERGAALKLGYFQLWSRFAFGAFGDAHVNRRDLMPIARAQAAQVGAGDVPVNRIVVIGDTPLDVDCARAHGARSVGVATGPFSRADLATAEADLALDTLEDTDEFLRWLDAR